MFKITKTFKINNCSAGKTQVLTVHRGIVLCILLIVKGAAQADTSSKSNRSCV